MQNSYRLPYNVMGTENYLQILSDNGDIKIYLSSYGKCTIQWLSSTMPMYTRWEIVGQNTAFGVIIRKQFESQSRQFAWNMSEGTSTKNVFVR